MQLEIRLAESGHSYHYSQHSTVHSLMQEIRKDFKIQLQDQKIIIKSGQILKSTMSFDSLQELMKKTLSTNFQSLPSTNKQIKQIQCLYVYNQKQLLRPVQSKIFNQQYFLKLLKEKCKQMALLAQNSYESKNFHDKVIQKNINTALQSINKRLNTPFQDITERHFKFLDSLNQRNYTKMQISALLDLIQNQDKARKLLIRNIQYLFDRKTKKRFISISQKITKQLEKFNQLRLKQSSSFFSNSKQIQSSQELTDLNKKFKQTEQKYTKFYQKLKHSKKQVTKGKFMEDEKITFNFDKKTTSMQKEYEQNVKVIKNLFDQFCQEILRINLLVSRTKQKQVKDLLKNLMTIDEKIYIFEKKVEENIKQFTSMYLQLSKIHIKGESQSIKQVFMVYVELIRSYEQLDVDIKRMQKDLTLYKEDKSAKISQFNQEGRNLNLPLKKSVRSPKKQDKKGEYQQSSISKQLQNNMPKINSPIKNKINKGNIKLFNEEITFRNFETALKQNKQLPRRLLFNKRLQGIMKYCSDLCQKEQELRREFRNSKEFEANKIDLLGVLNVPSVEVDFNETTDVELSHLYKKWMMQNSLQIETKIDWQSEVVQCVNNVNKTLTVYLASKSNTSERERNLQKILSVLSETFYKMAKNKIQTQTQRIKKSVSEQLETIKREQFQKLIKQNQLMKNNIRELQMQRQYKMKEIAHLQQNKIQLIKAQIKNEQIKQNICLNKEQNQFIKRLEEQNTRLKQQIKSLSQKLFSYRQQVDQTTQRLIDSYEESHGEELTRINHELKTQKDKNLTLTKQIKDLRTQMDKAKKNLIRQVETCQTLCKEIQDLEADKQFYQKEFAELKNLLADKQVAIIKLQKQIQKQIESLNKLNTNKQNQEGVHECQYQQEVLILRQDKQALQQEIQALDRQLKEILFKQTEDQQVQTQQCFNQSVSFVSQNFHQQNVINNQQTDRQTEKVTYNNFTYNQQNVKYSKQAQIQMNKISPFQTNKISPFQTNKISPFETNKISPFETKPLNANDNESHFNRQCPLQIQNHIVSKYYISSMAQQWMSTFPTFTPISIGKSIEQGMSHVFLPFAGDIYIGVTVNQLNKQYNNQQNKQYNNQQKKQYNNCQQYLTQNQTYSKQKQPVYILDIKDYNHKTAELIRQCSLVLVVKVDKKSQISMGNKVMVSGKIQFALGFEDDDMTIKNYSHFLQQ